MIAFFRRFAAVPWFHLIVAAALAGAVASAFWLETRMMPVDYTSSALLSYQVPHQFLAERSSAESDIPVVRIADTVLTPATLRSLADQTHFLSEDIAQPSSARVAAFRSHVELEQPAPGLLQVTFHGPDAKQNVAAANALAGSLAAWVPKPAASLGNRVQSAPAHSASIVQPTPAPAAASVPVAPSPAPRLVPPPASVAVATRPAPTAADKRRAGDMQRQAADLQENLATLLLQQRSIESRILARIAEEKALEHAAPKSPTDPASGSAPNHQQMAAIAKELDSLRALRSTVVIEETKERKQAQTYKAQAAALLNPAPVAAPQEEDAAPVAASLSVSESAAQPAPDAKPANVVVPVAAAPAQTFATPAVTDPLTSAGETQGVWQGSFSVLSWGEKAHPLGDDARQTLLWSGGILAAFTFLAYLGLMAWRFRPVSNPATLRNVLPRGAKYFGSVAGSPVASSALAASPFRENSL